MVSWLVSLFVFGVEGIDTTITTCVVSTEIGVREDVIAIRWHVIHPVASQQKSDY